MDFSHPDHSDKRNFMIQLLNKAIIKNVIMQTYNQINFVKI